MSSVEQCSNFEPWFEPWVAGGMILALANAKRSMDDAKEKQKLLQPRDAPRTPAFKSITYY